MNPSRCACRDFLQKKVGDKSAPPLLLPLALRSHFSGSVSVAEAISHLGDVIGYSDDAMGLRSGADLEARTRRRSSGKGTYLPGNQA